MVQVIRPTQRDWWPTPIRDVPLGARHFFTLPNHGFSRPYLARRLLVRLVCPAIRFHRLVSLVNVDQGLDRMVVVRRYCWGRSVSSVFLPLCWSVANKNKRLGSSCLLYERFGATRQVRSRTNPERKMHDASQECLRPKKKTTGQKKQASRVCGTLYTLAKILYLCSPKSCTSGSQIICLLTWGRTIRWCAREDTESS